MSAAIAARRGAEASGIACSITLLERNQRLGTKIRISGGGKCNVTHQGTPAEMLEQGFLRLNERRFLRNALYGFSSSDLLELLHSRGVETEVRPDGKVFPLSGDASSVALAFEELLKEAETLTADAVILATGGVSYSATGTTGDGLVIARKLGHTIKEPSAALAPVFTLKAPPASLSGVSLRSAGLVASAGGKCIERRGDLLFTHRGFSGPAALSLSRDIAELCRDFGSASLFADLFPEHNPAELDHQLLQHARKHGAQMVRKFLQICPIAPSLKKGFIEAPYGTIPTALVPFIIRHALLEIDITWSTLQKEQRQSLLTVLKRFPLGTVRNVPLDQGEVSAGGILLGEVNPKTMQSRVLPNLFLCGELLDYAGEIGGYNLQAAISTGWTAGINALKKC